MGDNNELAVVSQIGIITNRLEEVSKDIEFRTKEAMSLVCNEENLATIKKVRANLNKEFADYETLRKNIKTKINEPYKNFEERYVELIANAFKTSEDCLKSKINETESNIKSEKENELRFYCEEYIESLNLSHLISFEKLNIKVNMSDSSSKLMKEVKDKVDDIEKTLKIIELDDFNSEILVEYLKDFDYVRAKTTIVERVKTLEKIKKQEELRKQKEQQEQIIVQKVEEEIVPVEIVDNSVENFTVRFEVQGTKEQLKGLKQYMLANDLKFKNI